MGHDRFRQISSSALGNGPWDEPLLEADPGGLANSDLVPANHARTATIATVALKMFALPMTSLTAFLTFFADILFATLKNAPQTLGHCSRATPALQKFNACF